MRLVRPLLRRWTTLAPLLAVSLILVQHEAKAVEPDEVLPNPALEARARALSHELRCFVCQNQSIDDSNAPLARDLRILVRERLKQGDSDDQVKSFIVSRYGNFVLLRPPFQMETLLLWLTPLLVLAATGVLLFRRLRRAGFQPSVAVPPLTADETNRLRDLLAEREAAADEERPPS